MTVESDQRLRMDIVAVASDQLNDLGFMSSRQQHNYHAPRLLGKVVLSGVPAASAAVIFALAAICTLAGRATHQTDWFAFCAAIANFALAFKPRTCSTTGCHVRDLPVASGPARNDACWMPPVTRTELPLVTVPWMCASVGVSFSRTPGVTVLNRHTGGSGDIQISNTNSEDNSHRAFLAVAFCHTWIPPLRLATFSSFNIKKHQKMTKVPPWIPHPEEFLAIFAMFQHFN